jgi:hypothetical protein
VTTETGAEVGLAFIPEDTICRPVSGRCEPFGELGDGTAVMLWSDSAHCGASSQPAYVSVIAPRQQGYWSTSSENRCAVPASPNVVELRNLLDTVRWVTVAAWVDAT